VIALSGVLTSQFWNGAFLIYGVAFLIFLAMLVYIYEPVRSAAAHDAPEAAGQPFPWKTVATFSTVTLFSSTLYYVFIVQGGLAFDALGVTSPRSLGLIISGVSVGVPVGAVLFGLLSRWLAPAGLVAIYLGLLGLGMLGVGMARSVETMAASAFVQQIGAGMSIPSLILWATGSLSAQQRGRGMGLWAAAFFLGQFLSPLAVGAVRTFAGGILGTFAVMGAIALAGAGLAILMTLRGAGRHSAGAATAA